MFYYYAEIMRVSALNCAVFNNFTLLFREIGIYIYFIEITIIVTNIKKQFLEKLR